MPTKIEKDAITGIETTGHEWDGIRELNNPLPRWWLYVLYACIVWSVAYWFVFPAIPWFSGYTKGLLGYDQRSALDAQLAVAYERQGVFRDAIAGSSLADIRGTAELLPFAITGGRAAFADNCAPCHGLGGAGQAGGYPSLADDAWLWGCTLDQVHATLQYGIRSDHPDTRWSEMPAFGVLEILASEEIDDVAEYVLNLSGAATDAAAAQRGAEIYEIQCLACHSEGGTGLAELGAPSLGDQIWLYAATRRASSRRSPSPGTASCRPGQGGWTSRR